MFPQRRMTTDTPDGNYSQALNLFVRGEDGWVQMPSRSISLNDYMKQLIRAINEGYHTHTVALDKKGNPYINGGNVVFRDERDNAKATRHILVEALQYVIKSPARREQAEQRRADIEQQLSGSKYGIAYTDGTERIVQLNRSLENNILKSIEYLTNMVYSQLGVTQEILNGTADEKTMNNYMNRIIEPVIAAIADEFKRKFLTKTARTQGQSIMFFRDPFRLAPVSMIAEMADKFTRNEIMTPNEFRQVIGMKPSKDPKSDQLANRNIASADKKMPM